MIHKPLIVQPATDQWQAWCPTCNWESHTHTAAAYARLAATRHIADTAPEETR